MSQPTFFQIIAPKADRRIDTSKLPPPDSDYMKEFERIQQEQFGIKITNLSGHRIGFTKAWPAPWRPQTGFRETLRGTLKKYEVSTVHATDNYRGSDGIWYVQDEYDWNLYIEPAPSYKEKFPADEIQGEVTPPPCIRNTQWFPLKGSVRPSELLNHDICIYGPYVIDEGNDNWHEMHPIDAIWWREGSNQIRVFLLQDAATGRFRNTGMFVKTLIRPLAEGDAGEASRISVQAFNESEALTALRDGSGDLRLIGWHIAPHDFTITRGPDSETQAGEVSEVALALLGRRAITAVRSGSNHLVMIVWNVPPGLNSITRLWDSGTAAGEASNIAITALSDSVLVTAVRDGSGNLKLISWRLQADNTLSRLTPEGAQAGEVSLVTIARVDANNVVTAVRDGSGNLKLIGWSVSPLDGSIQRWPHNGEAGEISEIALIPIGSNGSTIDVVTAVRDGSENLTLIAWRLSPGAGTIERLADSFGQTGTASDIDLCSTFRSPSGTQTIIASVRRGSDNLGLIAFDLSNCVFIRNGDVTNEDDTDVTETALIGLEPGRILSACVIDEDFHLETYSISDVSSDFPAWKPWIEYPQLEEIKISFSYDPSDKKYWHIVVDVNKAVGITTDLQAELRDIDDGAQHQLLQARRSANANIMGQLPILVRVTEEAGSDNRHIAVQFTDLTRDARGIIRGYVQLVAALGDRLSLQEGALVITLTFKQGDNLTVIQQ